MDFGIIYQLKTKNFWWVDVVLYFSIALFIATFICYFIFLLKISSFNQQLTEINAQLEQIATAAQKETEKQVFIYQQKINDFSALTNNHKYPTLFFCWLNKLTLPNVWFNTFSIDTKTKTVTLAGEAERPVTLSRQLAILDADFYTKSIFNLVSFPSLGGKASFSFNLNLNQEIFFAPDLKEQCLGDFNAINTAKPSSGLFLNPDIL